MTVLDDSDRGAILDRVRPLVLSTIRRCLGRCAREDREDVAQEVFLKLFRNLGCYDPSRAKLSTWVVCVTRNHCFDVFRRRRPRTVSLHVRLPNGDRAADPADPPENGPVACAQLAELRNAFADAVARLRPWQRELVELRHADRLAYEVIARRLDLRPGTVKSRLHRAHRVLRERLSASGWGAVRGRGSSRRPS